MEMLNSMIMVSVLFGALFILLGFKSIVDNKTLKKANVYIVYGCILTIFGLIMILIIGFIVIILVGFNMINPDKNLTELAKKLKDYDERITVFQSANKRTIAINCNFDNEGEATEKSTEIGKIINNYMDYLGAYKNISMDVYTENGMKTSFTIDTATRKIEKDKQETWALENSAAYNAEQNKLKEIQTKQNEIKSEISSLENKKQTLNTEIQELNSEVVKIKGQPKTYPAGQLTAGTDIPVGKYKIYDGKSNFVVYSKSGELKVNIILGAENYGVNEYVYTFKEGDMVKANSSFKLVTIE